MPSDIRSDTDRATYAVDVMYGTFRASATRSGSANDGARTAATRMTGSVRIARSARCTGG